MGGQRGGVEGQPARCPPDARPAAHPLPHGHPEDARTCCSGWEETSSMSMAHYRIYELDPADQIMDGYSVMCRSDTAALAMASNCAENRAAAVEVWESERQVAPPRPRDALAPAPAPVD